MASLEDLRPGASVRGIVANETVTVIAVEWHAPPDVVGLTYRDASGGVGDRLLFRDNESDLAIVTEGRPWSFSADSDLLRLVSEAL